MPKPKTPSTRVQMQPHPPLPANRWIPVILTTVRPDGDMFRFRFTVPDRREQAGRQVEHAVQAFMAPGSPLVEFLAAAFDVQVAMDAEIELADLIGRNTEAKFSKPGPDGGYQQIVAWRPVSAAKPTAPSSRPQSGPSDSAGSTSARSSTPAPPAGPAGTAVTRANPEKGGQND